MISAVLGQFLAGPYRGTVGYTGTRLVARTVAFGLSGGNLRTYIQLPIVRGVYALAGGHSILSPIWGAGTFALSGHASGFAIGVPAASNAFAFTGNSAVLLKSSNGNLSASVGSFSIVGRSAANAIGTPIGSGTFALTGRALGDALGFPASSGVFALTGRAASSAVGMPAGAGTFALTGNTTAISSGHAIPAGSGTFALTGRSAANAIGMPASAGNFALTGNAATLVYSTITTWSATDKSSNVALSNSNLTATLSASVADSAVRGTITHGAGHYFEVTVDVSGYASGGPAMAIGLANTSQSLSTWIGADATNGIAYGANGYVFGTGGGAFGIISNTGVGYGAGDVIGVEILSSTANVYKNNSLIFTFTSLPSGSLYPAVSLGNLNDAVTADFGATSLLYMPSGDTSWNG